MTEAEAKEAAETLGLIAQAERASESFYRACAEAEPDHATVWHRIADAEGNHAVWATTLATWLMERQGDGFRIGRPFRREAILAYVDRVRQAEAEVRTGELKGGSFT